MSQDHFGIMSSNRKSQKKSMPSFLSKTYSIVMDPKNDDVISFNENGNAFVVKDEMRLSRDILPAHFKHQHFSSFIRQLNMYGFKKIRNSLLLSKKYGVNLFVAIRQLLNNISRRNGTIRKTKTDLEKKYSQRQQTLELQNKYLELRQDIIEINSELNFIVNQFGQFQNTQQTLIESSRSQLIELSLIKNRNQACNDLLCQVFVKLAENQNKQQNKYSQYQANQTTKSNGSGNSDNNEQNEQIVGSSKDDTNQSNGTNGSNLLEYEKNKVEQ